MDRSNLELKVGIMSIVAIIVLVVGSIWGKDVRLSSSYHEITFVFDNSGGLRSGDPVHVNGVKVGRVQAVRLAPQSVLIDVIIDQQVDLREDMEAAVTMQDLMGTTMMEISPGSSARVLTPEDFAKPIPGHGVVSLGVLFQDFERMKTRVDTLVSNLNIAAVRLNSMLDPEIIIEPMKVTATNVRAASTKLNTLVDKNSSHIESAIANISETTSKLNQLIQTNGPDLEKSIGSMSAVIARLDSFSTELQAINKKLAEKDGTVAKLIHSNETYDNLQATITSVDSLTKDLKKNMGRYLQGTDVNLFNFLKF